jgi:hypothetical protein
VSVEREDCSMKRPLRVLYTGKASCEAEAVTCSTCYAEIAERVGMLRTGVAQALRRLGVRAESDL